MNLSRILFYLTILLILPILATAQNINKIDIIGLQRISTSTVEAYLENKVGTQYDKQLVDNSIKNLFSTGFFSNIKIFPKGDVLVVELEENPMINQIAFEGNKKVKDKDIMKELIMGERAVFSNTKLQQDLKRILHLYHKKGRYSASVEPKIIKLDQNRINLIYEIQEGTSAKIEKINFIGNDTFSDEALRGTILSKESRWYRFFSSSDLYDPDKLNFDQELLRRHYLSEGYADFEIRSATVELSPLKDAFILNFVIHEGPVYTVKNIKIESHINYVDPEKLYPLLDFKAGSIYDINHVENSIDNINDYLGELGYAFVDIEDTLKKDPANKTLDITFTINETYKVYVNKINIKNNTRTLDSVIRREFRLAEGDPYNATRVFRSKQRIDNLGYFSSVEFKNLRTESPDKMDIDVEVQETSTGALNFAGGYDTSLGVIGSISLTESNFLGKGQEVGVEFMKAKKSSDISLSFTEPYFMEYPLAVGFDIFSNSRNRMHESGFNSQSRGFVLRGAYELNEHLYHSVRYALKKQKVMNVAAKSSIYIKEQEGENMSSIIGQTFTYDKLDNRIDPTKGFLLKINQDFAGLGGQSRYINHNLVGAFYYPVYKRDVILSFVARAGNIFSLKGKTVRINDRTFIGGEEIRGFEAAGIGPRTKVEGDALGGTSFYTGSLDLTFPLGLSQEYGIKGVVFTDFGSLFNPSVKKVSGESFYSDHFIRASYGIGIKWNSALGNIRIYYGVPFRKKKYDERKALSITFGTRF